MLGCEQPGARTCFHHDHSHDSGTCDTPLCVGCFYAGSGECPACKAIDALVEAIDEGHEHEIDVGLED